MVKDELLSEFKRWAEEVLTEYIRLLKDVRLLKESRRSANEKISRFVLSIQEDYQKLAVGLRDIVLDLFSNSQALPYTHILHAIIRPRLLNCIRNIENPEIDEQTYSRLVNDVKFLLHLKLDTNRAWAYLHQFGCLNDFVELEGPLRIRRVTLIESYQFDLTNQSVGGKTRCDFIVETTSDTSFIQIDESNNFMLDNATILEDFRTLVTALRLTTPSSTGLNIVSLVCQIPLGKTTIRLNMPALFQFNPAPEIFPAAFSPYVDTQCILDKHELELFQRLYKRLREIKLKEGKLNERLQRALRRYNVALISDQAEDAIVDAIIGLEILFQTTGFRMAFRASYLAGIGSEERKIVVETLDKSHKMRSGIVHGRTSKKNEQTSLLGKLIIITCRVLRSYLHVSSKNEDVISLIENIAYNLKTLLILEKELAKWSRAETSWVWKPSESLADLLTE